MQEQEPIIIIIEDEETPLVPEKRGVDVKAKAGAAGQQVAATTRQAAAKAWDSEPRKKVTGGIKKGATAVAAKGGQIMADAAEKQAKKQAEAVQVKIKETDWKAEAKTGTANGLRWLSEKVSVLADRFTPVEKEPPSTE